MENEQTNKSDTLGKENDKPLETDNKVLSPDGTPLSDYDKAVELVKRREEATKEENKMLDRKEKLAANTMLGGNSGGHVETAPKEETAKEYREKIDKNIQDGKYN